MTKLSHPDEHDALPVACARAAQVRLEGTFR